MPQPKPSGQYWNDPTVAQPRNADGSTPDPAPGAQIQNFGTSDGDADRKPTLLDEHGRVTSGPAQPRR